VKRAASVKTGGSRAKSVGAKDRPALVDRRFESSRAVLLGVEAAIRAKGGPAAGEEIPASLYFAAIMAGLQSGVGTSTVEVTGTKGERGTPWSHPLSSLRPSGYGSTC
jgi:hypothetical protein